MVGLFFQNHPYSIAVQNWQVSEKMGTKMKQRDVANQKASQATLSVNERILKECHHLYTEADNGLIEVIFAINMKIWWSLIWWLIYVIISLSIYCCWVCPKEGDLVMTIFSVSNCHLVLLLIIFFRSLLYCLICNLHPCYVTQSSSRVC